MPAGASLTWQIVYIFRGTVGLKLVKGKAGAIDAACKILDAGGEVSGAECVGTIVALSAVQLHQIWMRRKAGRSG